MPNPDLDLGREIRSKDGKKNENPFTGKDSRYRPESFAKPGTQRTKEAQVMDLAEIRKRIAQSSEDEQETVVLRVSDVKKGLGAAKNEFPTAIVDRRQVVKPETTKKEDGAFKKIGDAAKKVGEYFGSFFRSRDKKPAAVEQKIEPAKADNNFGDVFSDGDTVSFTADQVKPKGLPNSLGRMESRGRSVDYTQKEDDRNLDTEIKQEKPEIPVQVENIINNLSDRSKIIETEIATDFNMGKQTNAEKKLLGYENLLGYAIRSAVTNIGDNWRNTHPDLKKQFIYHRENIKRIRNEYFS